MPAAGVKVSYASSVVDISKDAKLAALMDKKDIAPLDSSSMSVSALIPGGPRNWNASGFCFASAETFINSFDYKEVIDEVTIDVSRAHFWDITAVSALDKVVIKFKREGTEVEVIGMNEASRTLVDKFAIHDKDDALERMAAH